MLKPNFFSLGPRILPIQFSRNIPSTIRKEWNAVPTNSLTDSEFTRSSANSQQLNQEELTDEDAALNGEATTHTVENDHSLITNIVMARPFYAFDIKNPPKYVQPHTFIGEHLEKLYSEINLEEPARDIRHSLQGQSYKIWIWATNFYSKISVNKPQHSIGGFIDQIPQN